MPGPPSIAFFPYEPVNQIPYEMRRSVGRSYTHSCSQPSCACANHVGQFDDQQYCAGRMG